MPQISVIIPAYNAQTTILETIASVQKQTFSDFELIVINDGSTDQTLELLHRIKDDRLKVFSYANGGLPTARNRGIAQASGEFLAFLDADDLWTPDKLALQLEALLQHPEAGVAYSWTYFMEQRNDSRILHRCKPVYYQGDVYPKLLVGDFIYNGSNTLIRRSAIDSIDGFDLALKSCEDWDYWVRLAAKWPFVVVPKYQIFYRRSANSNSLSSKIETMRESALAAIDKAFRAAPPELQHLKRLCLSSFNLYCADLHLQHSKQRKSLNQAGLHLWRAITLNPSLLLASATYKKLIKLILMQSVSPSFASRLIGIVNKIRSRLALLQA